MQVSEKGLAFVACREACVLTAYRDTRLLAIGFGQNDPGLKEGDTISLDKAIALFVKSAAGFDRGLSKIFKDVPLTQWQWDTLFSLAYNIGAGALSREAELVRWIKALAAMPMSDPIYRTLRDRAGYEIVRARWSDETGPFNLSRRCREAILFVSGDYGDLATLKLWPEGKSPRHTPPDQPISVPMPTFNRILA